MKPTPKKPRINIAQVDGSGTAPATENSICFTSLKPPVSDVVTKIDLMMSPSVDHPPKLAKSVFAAMAPVVPVKVALKISVIVTVTVPPPTSWPGGKSRHRITRWWISARTSVVRERRYLA